MTSVHERGGDRHRGEGHMTAKAKIEMMQLQAQETLEPPEDGRNNEGLP